MAQNVFTLKKNFRNIMKNCLKQISSDEKQRQTNIVLNYLSNHSERFKNSKHVALYLAMKDQEIDTIPLIERLLKDKSRNKHIYVPHVEMSSTKSSEMFFYELKDIDQYMNEMCDDNKYKIKQFKDLSSLTKADESLFDLVIVPGLAFSGDNKENTNRPIKRLGRGKGYYDRFLNRIPDCYTIGIGFNQQLTSFNESLNDLLFPFDESKDVGLNEFLCENLINEKISCK